MHSSTLYVSADIVVGFEQTSYAIAEGGMSEICVVIISPDDIETTQVYLEVIPINNTNGVGNEASKFATFHLKYYHKCRIIL